MENEIIKHYGTPHDGSIPHSGRYEYGSGANGNDEEYIMSEQFLLDVEKLRKKGIFSQIELAKAVGAVNRDGTPSTKIFREKLAAANSRKKASDIQYAVRMHEKGYSNVYIGKKMGIPESSVRNLLDPIKQERALREQVIVDCLKKDLEKTGYVDVGKGAERWIGGHVTPTQLKIAVQMLRDEGYVTHYTNIKQLGSNNQNTSMLVLTDSSKTHKDVYENKDKIVIPNEYQVSPNGKKVSDKMHDPVSIDSKRILVNWGEDGGKNKDGVIELRKGVPELDLGDARYAQVRVAVDNTHYLKGMAIYKEDMPDGIDIIYNVHYTREECHNNPKEAMKPMKANKYMIDDPTAPLGSYISRQNDKKDENGKILVKGALNIINEEYGEHEWDKYDKNLASQFLSKQKPELAKQQLDMALDDKKDQLDTIKKLTNPVIKQYYLNDFAEECESDAVSLKAAALPRQATKVLLPITSLKDNEVYAPGYRNGEEVALVRYPHGGIFEIPVLKVNNNNKQGKEVIGNKATSAIGINIKTAAQLSGADFDGDTVIVIPTKGVKISSRSTLEELKDFDPQVAYKNISGAKPISSENKQRQMGIVSNLITDMTLKGASFEEIARADRHSMVVIDAEKHNLDYRKSYIDNGIAALKERYQRNKLNPKTGKYTHGASTLISKAKSEIRVPERVYPVVDKNTGEISYKNKIVKLYNVSKDEKTGKKIYTPILDENGKQLKGPSTKTIKSTLMAESKDAMELISEENTKMEQIYAKYANNLKDLAKAARKESVNMTLPKESSSAKKVYAKEVESLNAKLNEAYKNKPLERRAQVIANQIYKQKEQASPEGIAKGDKKKVMSICLGIARTKVNAGKKDRLIKVEPKEWEAIQANAISSTKLKAILNNTDKDTLKEYAMPKVNKVMTSAKVSRAKAMLNRGYTLAEVADSMGVSVNTLNKSIK